jgi:hypothetical protein
MHCEDVGCSGRIAPLYLGWRTSDNERIGRWLGKRADAEPSRENSCH